MAEKQNVVLVIEDEPAIRRGIADALGFAGHAVREAADGEEGLRMAFAAGIDLILLDLMLPKRNGFDILKEVRRVRPTLPVIILTARGAEDDRVRGLKGGADDYVVKPFSARELIARVEAVLRRSPERREAKGAVRIAGRMVHLDRREVELPDKSRRELSQLEADLLSYLVANRDRAVSREELLERVWGIAAAGLQTRTVDMHVARLREKLDDTSETPEVIVTVRAKGYMIGPIDKTADR